jgi:hypothetical protein
MPIVFVVVLLVTLYVFSVMNREWPLDSGEIFKSVAAFIVFAVFWLVVITGLLIGSGETDITAIVPPVGAAVIAVFFAALVTVALKAVAGNRGAGR